MTEQRFKVFEIQLQQKDSEIKALNQKIRLKDEKMDDMRLLNSQMS